MPEDIIHMSPDNNLPDRPVHLTTNEREQRYNQSFVALHDIVRSRGFYDAQDEARIRGRLGEMTSEAENLKILGKSFKDGIITVLKSNDNITDANEDLVKGGRLIDEELDRKGFYRSYWYLRGMVGRVSETIAHEFEYRDYVRQPVRDPNVERQLQDDYVNEKVWEHGIRDPHSYLQQPPPPPPGGRGPGGPGTRGRWYGPFGGKPVDVNVNVNVNEGNPVTAEGQYEHFLNIEEWGSQELKKIDREAKDQPLYYGGDPNKNVPPLSEKRKDEVDARRELNNAVHYKRFDKQAQTLEGLANNKSLEALSKEETKLLFGIPGVWGASVLYVRMSDADQFWLRDRAQYPFRYTRDRDTLKPYREWVREQIRPQVIAGLQQRGELRGYDPRSEDYKIKVDRACRSAEQVAFNMAYVGNLFEAQENKWTKIREGKYKGCMMRTRIPIHGSPAVNVPVRDAMNPMNALVDSLLKPPSGQKDVGAFGRDAYDTAQISIKEFKQRYGVDIAGFAEVVILPNTLENENKFWTIEPIYEDRRLMVNPEGKAMVRIYAFEAYEHNFLPSAWEEFEIGGVPEAPERPKVKGKAIIEIMREKDAVEKYDPYANRGGRSILDILEEPGLDEALWGSYDYKISKADAMWQLLSGKKALSLGAGGGGGSRAWVTDVLGTLRVFNLRTDEDLKTRILYASVGLKEKSPEERRQSRAPKIAGGKEGLEIELGQLRYVEDRRNLFLAWDRIGRARRIF